MEELDAALRHVMNAKASLEDGGNPAMDIWMARAKLEVFLVKLSLLHGFEEEPEPNLKHTGKVEINVEVLDEILNTLSLVNEAYLSENFREAFEKGWLARELLTKLV
nr:hypothetical protein [Candidatus Bathyarchaeota archaeon]